MQTLAPPSQLGLLVRDVYQSICNWQFWGYLGWNDVAKQYRRTFLGPVWITLNSAFFIVAFGLVGAQLFKLPLEEYLPYFCAGHILFSFLSLLINDGCQTFTSADAFLKQTAYPKFAFVLRVVCRNLILLGHNLVVVIVVLIWSDYYGPVNWFAFIVGLFTTAITAAFVVAILGAVSARFRDIPMVVGSVMQISFFVTPVMWNPSQLTERAQWLVHLNPLASFLEVLRRPLLGQVVPGQTWAAVLSLMGALFVVFVVLYLQVRRRIVYWL